MNQDILRGGMIGAGAWSRVQLDAWTNVRNAKIVALCDHHPERRKSVAQQFDIESQYNDIQSMLLDCQLDFVDVCTRPNSHKALCEVAANYGCHIICQKPYCQNLSEAKAVNTYVQGANTRLMVNENFRWQGWYRQIKTLLNEGAIGEPFMANLHVRQQVTMPEFNHRQVYFKGMPKLLLYEMGTHYLDTARYLFGDPDTIYARLHQINASIAGEDVMSIVLGYRDLTVNICSSWASLPIPHVDLPDTSVQAPPPPRFQIDGTKGTLALHASGDLSLHTYEGEKQSWSFTSDTRPLSRTATQQHFIDCLVSNTPFETSGEETVLTMALVYAGYQSALAQQVISPASLTQIT